MNDDIRLKFQGELRAKVKSLEIAREELTKPGLYLSLFHGRADPKQDMEDWGEDGPIFGPLANVHITYLTSISLTFADDSTGPMHNADDPLHFVEGLLCYEGMYYGDWACFYYEG